MPQQRGLALDSPAFDEVEKVWNKAIESPGSKTIVVLSSYGKAVAFRHKMYRWRRMMQSANRITPYDNMEIKLQVGDNRLYIDVKDEGIVSIETTPGMETQEIGDMIVANWPKEGIL